MNAFERKAGMEASTQIVPFLLSSAFGLLSGIMFNLIVGNLDGAGYLVEQLNLGLVEIPFIVLCAVIVRKYGWRSGILFCVFGIGVSATFFYHEKSITPVVF